ncbi:MAG: ATP-binding protein [Muribaculaceae bacterium]|nr:ATP-binding protein [Muribaculaceae bacterium]MDE7509654.1 ATP-binding protein [Muribaculaceae bacterium]
MESLTIRNIGPIKFVDLQDIRRFNVFIGESGSGKSTIMKVLAMMRWIYKMACVRTYCKNSGIQTPFRFRADSILGDNGLRPFFDHDSEVVYKNGSYSIIYRGNKLIFPKKNVAREELSLQKIAYISDKRILIPDLASGNVSLRHNMFYLDETYLNYQKALDAIPTADVPYLGVKMAVRKTTGGARVFVSAMDGNHNFENLPLPSASSGLQSSVALHMITRYFSHYYNIVEAMNSTIVRFLAAGDNLSKFSASFNVGDFPNQRISLHLEEPELSLFPSNQWGLMKYLVTECLSAERARMDLTMATHSPYILTALNIMMLAYTASHADPAKYDESGLTLPMIAPEDVCAWSVVEGKCESLLNSELGMIDGTHLDGISDDYEQIITILNDIVYV